MTRALFAIVLAACTTFDPIERDVCGNGLLEVGEDCDSDDPSCLSCSVSCDTSADCPTTDYACGVDGLCHAPGGALGQPATSTGAFGANELRITDINHDGVGDALGLSQTSIVVRHGDASGVLGADISVVTPAQTGPAGFGDLDNDGSLDLTLTTPDGLVSYTSPYGELAPLAVQGVVLDGASNMPLDLRLLFHVAPTLLSGFIADPSTGNLYLFVLDFANPSSSVFTAPCGSRIGAIRAADFDASMVEVYQVHRDGDARLDTIVTLLTGTTNRKLCVTAIHRDAPPLIGGSPAITATDITPAGAAPVKRPVLADLDTDADRCPGLVNRDGGPKALTQHDGALVNGLCAFAATATQLPPIVDASPTAELVGRIPVDPPVLYVAADALVTSDAVNVFLPGGIPIFAPNLRYSPVYRSTRRIARAVSGHLDNDNHVDAIIAAEGEDDLDLLYRVPDEAGFQLLRIDTASDVSTITFGDYDGNGYNDIAFTERQETHERMMIAYGTPDRPLAPVSVGAFPGIVSVTRMQFGDSIDYLGLADDLIVIGPPPPGGTLARLSFLHGSPQRTMLSYFDPRQDAARDETLFRGAVIGHFASSGTSEFRDVLALAPSARSSTTSSRVRAWRVPGTPAGLDGTQTPGVDLQGLVDCSISPSSLLCLDDARYLAFPTAADHDVVIGVDRARRAVMVDPWSTANPVAATSLGALAEKIPAGTFVRSLHAADLDGDGTNELVAAFSPTTATSAGAVLVCHVSGGVPTSCEDIVPVIVAAGDAITQCFDAAPARMGPGPAADVIVVCRGETTGIYRVRGSEVVRLATTGATITSLRTGDVTGDGVADLVVVEGDVVKSLTVYPQCTSRDVACLAAGGGS